MTGEEITYIFIDDVYIDDKIIKQLTAVEPYSVDSKDKENK